MLFIIFPLIVIARGLIAVNLFNDFIPGIANWKPSYIPSWLATTLKTILSIIVFLLIVIGTISMGIVMLALAMGGAKK